ncbi:Vacuolar calcium ion transporter [Cladobotryum mycophilum]|uniref:Vacuolar calcium ion transporter n=1 Tax=Cladobotryum mycophilum TaxID=491253 RepID=A0ABR0SKM0_9HYPO
MKETSSDPPDIAPKRSGSLPGAHGYFDRPSTSPQPDDIQPVNASIVPVVDNTHLRIEPVRSHHAHTLSLDTGSATLAVANEKAHTTDTGSVSTLSAQIPIISPSKEERQGSILDPKEAQGINSDNDTENPQDGKRKRTVMEEVRRSFWLVATHSWMNVLLVFVPLGIIVAQINSISGGVVFAINCIAIIPLAGLLSFATESVAIEMGDALGALLNVTFGNAVELIIFIIALVKNQIRIVQASLLGSILANLLLILGMCFFFGGLRYREQVYNSTVTQMSACLLSLSVISLVLPTAFHASFSDSHRADNESLKISRGTSVILLLVYIIYLLFQLKSHAYMYESTPQHIVDAESAPGPAAAWLDHSSSDSSSSESSDSDDSRSSRDTMKRRMKKVLRAGRRRRSSGNSTELNRSGSFTTTNTTPLEEVASESPSRPVVPRIFTTEAHDEADDEERPRQGRRHSIRSFRKKHKKHRHRHRHRREATGDGQPSSSTEPRNVPRTVGEGEPRRVDFAIPNPPTGESPNESGTNGSNGATKRPFPTLRTMSVRHFTPTVFVQKPQADTIPPVSAGPVPRVRLGIRRTNSLPDRLPQFPLRAPGAMLPAQIPLNALNRASRAAAGDAHDEDEHLTQWASVILLLVTTGLVAACAEFLISSIEEVTSTSSLGEAFIGLILLPIVGNAAEHVTALTVAMKNKMDLAIGVAVGSSIQIAIFVTPLVVILGWIMDKDMTLYFTLFETVCLFVSAFIVNFLVLDGRSNYLEGALLCAVYCIIGVVAFFYPSEAEASNWGS